VAERYFAHSASCDAQDEMLSPHQSLAATLPVCR